MKRPPVVLAFAAALGTVSAAFASPALFAFATGLCLLTGAAWVLVALSERSLAVERLIAAAEVQEDAPVMVSFIVTRGDSLPVRVEVADHTGGWLPVIRGEASLQLHVGRPGRYEFAPTTLRVRDPIGLFERRQRAGTATELLVLPVPQRSAGRHVTPPGPTDDLEPAGLAPYAPGTPLTRIHWPALAKGAGLHVRRLAAPAGHMPLVLVDTAGAMGRWPLAWTARAAAGHILAHARNRGCRVLLPGDAEPTTVIGTEAAWRAIHRRLAMLDEPPTVTPAPRIAATAAVRVRAVSAPAMREPLTPLPEGVLTSSAWPPDS